MNLYSLFDNIRVEIARREWSINEYCEKLGVPRRRFYNWEERGDLPTSYLIKTAELFGMSTDYLLGLSIQADSGM